MSEFDHVVTVVIPTNNRREKLLRLLASIAAQDYPREWLRTIVVDNASTDGSAEAAAAAFPDVEIVRLERNAFAAEGRNVGGERGSGHRFFVDDDNILEPDCVRQLMDALEADPRLGVVAPLMLWHERPDVIWCAGGVLDVLGLPSHLHAGEARLSVLGRPLIAADYFPNAYLVRDELWEGGLRHNAVLFPHNWNEQDFCRQAARRGAVLAAVTAAVTRHDVGYRGPFTRFGHIQTFDQARSRILYRRMYRHAARDWATFFLLVLPVSTVAYHLAFLRQRAESPVALAAAYWRGTIAGFTDKIL